LRKMKAVELVLVFICVVGGVLCAPTSHVYLEHQEKLEVPSGWEEGERARGDEKVRLIFALTQSNLPLLHRLFLEVPFLFTTLFFPILLVLSSKHFRKIFWLAEKLA